MGKNVTVVAGLTGVALGDRVYKGGDNVVISDAEYTALVAANTTDAGVASLSRWLTLQAGSPADPTITTPTRVRNW